MTATKPTERLSNFELLRIIAILGIVLMHGIGCAARTTNELNTVALIAINAVGNMGVTLFVIISGYFGIRFRTSRLVGMWLMVLLYSILSTASRLYLGTAELTFDTLVTTLTPISSNLWWFMTCYIVLYCLSPFIDKMLAALNRRQTVTLIAVMTFFFILVPTFLFRTITNEPYGKSLPNFFLAYLIGRYIALYGIPAWLARHKGKVFAACTLLIFLGNYLQPNHFLLCKDNNILIVGGAISLFILFAPPYSRINIQSRLINTLARYTLPLYLANSMLLRFATPYYENHINDDSFLLYYTAAQCAIVLAAIIIETILRKVFGRGIERASQWAENRLNKALQQRTAD